MKWVVVPCDKGKKYPNINWKEYQTRFPTQEEHNKWFAEDCNIALVTGELSNVVVIDEDSYKKSGKHIRLGSSKTRQMT
ncbi:MAG: bifunctional DNA primase/polymerase, partial [Nanoarchaeota archaeon]